jgi:tetratricopeptide (TPR) repeat protein
MAILEKLFGRATAGDPEPAKAVVNGDADRLFARGCRLFDEGRHREARAALLRAEAEGKRGTALSLQLGLAQLHCGDAVAAETSLRRALELEPDERRARSALAMALLALRRPRDAEAAFEHVLALCPGDFECLWMIGLCRLGQGDARGAEVRLRQAIAADAQRAVAWKDLGAALDAQDRRAEAIEASTTAVDLDARQGVRSDSFINLAIELADEGRVAEALALHERMLPGAPHVYGHVAYAQALLKSGRLREGWPQYEFRFLCEPQLSQRQEFGRPIWSGQDLRGKTILLLAEQGLGDTIQFIRFVPRLKALGASVLFRAPVGFEEFAQGFPGVDKVLERGTTRVEFDYHLNLMSLPRAFDVDLASIPGGTPYLNADPDLESRWAPRLRAGDGLRVGLVWAGNPNRAADRHRSFSLGALAPLGAVAGFRFYSLQKGAREEEALTPPPGLALHDLGPELHDFRDTAAVLNQLDLIICVDTAVAHLAGALGKPVWLMLSKAPCWRWLQDREDSPWYPTMRLFRQRQHGEWGEVVEEIRQALQEVSKAGGAGSLPSPSRASSTPVAPVMAASDVPQVIAGLSAVAETRMGALQYLPDEPLLGDSLRWYGEVLQPQLELLEKLVRPGATVIEIGSGIGAHAVPLARMVGADGQVLSYESRPVQRQILRQNLGAHRASCVTLMRQHAVGSMADDQASTVDRSQAIDDLQLDRLALLKVNAGAESAEVLAGAAATLWRLRPVLFVAADGLEVLEADAARAREFGYRCWRMEAAWFNPGNFNRRDGDIFAGRNALTLIAIPEEMDGDMAQFGCVELS